MKCYDRFNDHANTHETLDVIRDSRHGTRNTLAVAHFRVTLLYYHNSVHRARRFGVTQRGRNHSHGSAYRQLSEKGVYWD